MNFITAVASTNDDTTQQLTKVLSETLPPDRWATWATPGGTVVACWGPIDFRLQLARHGRLMGATETLASAKEHADQRTQELVEGWDEQSTTRCHQPAPQRGRRLPRRRVPHLNQGDH